jgi:glutamyl-tRNA synthetase
MDGIASDRREESVEDSLKRFDEMTAGSDEGQKWCLRAKMSVDDPNKAMRDTVIYRCVKQAHHRTGFVLLILSSIYSCSVRLVDTPADTLSPCVIYCNRTKYFSYPTYDFACPVVDSLEGVTHALRTNEYRDRNPQYMWFMDALNIRKPNLWDFSCVLPSCLPCLFLGRIKTDVYALVFAASRLNFVYTLLSKRKLHQFVNDGQVTGWDDARFPTVRGIRRRGLTIEALKEFIILQGASQSQMTMEWDGIWTINKRIIDPIVPRYCALATKDLYVFPCLPCYQVFLFSCLSIGLD